ncbi:MAG: CHAT domain-containing protein [Candidatus Pseudobacter hemicellulosilyticus]|uniref:CHAT domain-containing protein n=1 Tax=Candidatus Pseudobacter hemicellulosilyticus TaxID=3121375 RepID=A0AAJ5WSV9_9BACT|nr:MAG: CHAT domain-containing protein [Pseudobacter sp.]
MNIFRITLTISLCLLQPWLLRAQCPTPAQWMQQIGTAEQSQDGLPERIRVWELWANQYARCKGPEDSIKARILHRLGDLYRQSGDVTKGIRYAKAAAAINSSGRPGAQPAFLTHSYYNLGLYYSQLYQFAASNAYFDSCITIGVQYPEKQYIALMAFEQKAFTYHQLGDYQHAVETASQGALLAQQWQDPQAAAFIRLQQVQAELALDRLAAAEQNILQVIQELRQDPTAAGYLATSYSVYALLLNTKKEPARAAHYYRHALALNKQLQNTAQCARDLIDLGYLYDLDLHNATRAMACYREGMQFAQQANDAYLKAGLYNNMGVVCWRQQQFRQALNYYQQGLTALPLSFSGSQLAQNPDMEQLARTGNDYFVYSLLANKAEALLELGKQENGPWLNAASQTYRLADRMVNQMRWKQQSEGSKLYWRQQTKKMYGQAIDCAWRLRQPEQAFYFFEKSRAVLLNDRLQELGARQYLPKADQEKEQGLRTRLASLQQQLAGLPNNDPQYQSGWQELYRTQEQLYHFLSETEKQHPAYYQYKYDTSTLRYDSLRSILRRHNQSLVEYFYGDSILYTLCISPEGGQLHRQVFPQYPALVRELMGLVASRSLLNKQYPRYRQLAGSLYDSLFRPLNIGTKRVILSPDDHFIPFELLLTDAADPSSFLVKAHAFSYAYSARFLLNRTQEQPLANRLLGFAPVHYQQHLQQATLAGADQSLKAISEQFSAASLLTGPRASKQQFLDKLAAWPVVQLYSHADADSGGREPVLYLADSALHLGELQALGPLKTRLMVLAACNTGVGKSWRGEGVFSLARGFAAAGIPSTITNLWPVDNRSTYALTEAFYQQLHEGLPADEALQQAKLDFLQNSDAEKELPYFWAASLLIGQPETLAPARRSGKMAWYAGSTGLLLILGAIGIRRFRKRAARKKAISGSAP